MRLLPTPNTSDAHGAAKVETRPSGTKAQQGLREWAASSAASVASTLPLAEPPPGFAKPTNTAPPSSNNIGPVSRSCPTCGNSTQLSDELTCCTVAIRASRSPSQANAEANPTRGICGLSSRDSFAFYDPASSSVKTSQATFDLDSTESLPILPAWGCMCDGELYELQMLVPLISEPGCSSLLATPMPSDVMGGRTTKGSERQGETGLRLQVKALLPTPCSQEPGGTPEAHLWRKNRLDGSNRVTPTHLAFIEALLPTPVGTDSFGARNRTSGRKTDSKHHDGTTLTDAIWITQGRTEDTMGNPLGEPTNPQSDGGNESANSQPPDQLTIEDD